MIWRLTSSIALAVLVHGATSAQEPALEQVLDRMARYLVDYETQLSSVVADERFNQRVDYPRSNTSNRSITRRLESEIGFIRLPGGAEWLGFRDVRKVDDRAVRTKGLTVGGVLASGRDVGTQPRGVMWRIDWTSGRPRELSRNRPIAIASRPAFR